MSEATAPTQFSNIVHIRSMGFDEVLDLHGQETIDLLKEETGDILVDNFSLIFARDTYQYTMSYLTASGERLLLGVTLVEEDGIPEFDHDPVATGVEQEAYERLIALLGEQNREEYLKYTTEKMVEESGVDCDEHCTHG